MKEPARSASTDLYFSSDEDAWAYEKVLDALDEKRWEDATAWLKRANQKTNVNQLLMGMVAKENIQAVKILAPWADCKGESISSARSALVESVKLRNRALFDVLLPYSDPKLFTSQCLYEAADWGDSDWVRVLIPLSDVPDSHATHAPIHGLLRVSQARKGVIKRHPLDRASQEDMLAVMALLLPYAPLADHRFLFKRAISYGLGEPVINQLAAFCDAKEAFLGLGRSEFEEADGLAPWVGPEEWGQLVAMAPDKPWPKTRAALAKHLDQALPQAVAPSLKVRL